MSTRSSFVLVLVALVVSVDAQVTWLHPSDGQYFPKGQSIQASWSSSVDAPVVSPSFRLCSSMDTCGTAIWPTITKDDHGNSHISLTAPPMDSDTPFFLTMRGDDMKTYSSPSFTLLAGTTPTAPVDPAPEAEESAWGLPDDPPTTTDDPFDTTDAPLTSAPTATAADTNDIPTPSDTPVVLSPSVPSIHSTGTPYPSAPITSPGVAAVSSGLPPPLVDSDAAMSTPIKPNVKAIAFPLGALGLISLGALIFLLRRKPVDPPSPPSAPAILDLEKAVGSLNEKAAESSFAAAQRKGSAGSDFGGAGAKMAEYATVATLAKDYPRHYVAEDRQYSGPGRDDRAYGRQPSSRLSHGRSQEHVEDPYTSPPRRGSRATLAPPQSASTVHRSARHPPVRRPSSNASILSASSYAPTPAPPQRRDTSRLAPPPATLSRQPSGGSFYSPGSVYASHASTPAFRPSPGREHDDDDERGLDILSFPWSHTPYTPSMSPPYMPTLRGVAGRPGMGVERRDTIASERRGGGGGGRGIYSDAEDVVGRERERRRERSGRGSRHSGGSGARRGGQMEELYGEVQRSLGSR